MVTSPSSASATSVSSRLSWWRSARVDAPWLSPYIASTRLSTSSRVSSPVTRSSSASWDGKAVTRTVRPVCPASVISSPQSASPVKSTTVIAPRVPSSDPPRIVSTASQPQVVPPMMSTRRVPSAGAAALHSSSASISWSWPFSKRIRRASHSSKSYLCRARTSSCRVARSRCALCRATSAHAAPATPSTAHTTAMPNIPGPAVPSLALMTPPQQAKTVASPMPTPSAASMRPRRCFSASATREVSAVGISAGCGGGSVNRRR